ncbi:uncharacterized protein N7459_002334 [Penicillium hispanicum]|uniref:uncharacterized protein n=1 Tax=Penicillium hispanicum TaxID=1080232 RepID=UPI002540D1C9|nr:uncharacterized protein N7459_002334 [Penicillium hispanicum]KAJ5591965.1 hypothetical protein N7459_002334 [Penicillium hispanicum]
MRTTRRNGQLPSCEPCRKSKLRCDHATPVCGRCVRRSRQNLCLYHPAPLTRADLPRARQKSTHVELHDGCGIWSQKKVSVSTPGFLGHTSYSDVFTDNGSDILTGGLASSINQLPFDAQRVQLGARALLLLKYLPLCRAIVTARFKVWKGWTLGWPITDMILTVTEEAWQALQQEASDEHKRALLLSRRLFEKSAHPMEIHATTSWSEFAAITAGRWETIGLLFTVVGLAMEFVSHEDTMFSDHGWTDVKSLAVIATAVGDLCLQFCDSAGIMNDMVCWLLLHHFSLLSVVYGDSDYRPWKKLGELSSAVFALGLHQESPDAPFFLHEMRKRTLIGAYSADKALATFLGRPPLISWRYCDIQMPLDLSCEEIAAEPDTREAAIANLTIDGWNQEGSLAKGAWARVSLLTGQLREKVLELFLTSRTENLAQQVNELSEELHQTYEQLPAFLHWQPKGGSKRPSMDEPLLFDLHLEFLYNDFLLYRLLAKRTHTHPEGIISISLEILNAFLSIVARVHREPILGWDIAWNLCYAGLPSAGVLCADLLCRFRRQLPESPASPRSEIIQKLSIFASHLDTMVQPDEGNYQIAQQGQKAIRHILDQVLSARHEPGSTASYVFQESDRKQEIVDTDWLDGMDFDDGGLFADWPGGTADSHEPWLAWMNFS